MTNKVRQDAEHQLAVEREKQNILQSTGTEGEVDARLSRWHGWDEIQGWADLLELGPKEFEDRISEKADNPIPENKVYGLLALERNGQNRAPYIKAAMKRLDLKPDELPGGGPAYANTVTPIEDL
jgi:hypothetical protein